MEGVGGGEEDCGRRAVTLAICEQEENKRAMEVAEKAADRGENVAAPRELTQRQAEHQPRTPLR
eukprot:92808-Hanusia_phi.AAC.2